MALIVQYLTEIETHSAPADRGGSARRQAEQTLQQYMRHYCNCNWKPSLYGTQYTSFSQTQIVWLLSPSITATQLLLPPSPPPPPLPSALCPNLNVMVPKEDPPALHCLYIHTHTYIHIHTYRLQYLTSLLHCSFRPGRASTLATR